jgi:hypothetical protein
LCLFYRKTKERDIVRNGKDKKEEKVLLLLMLLLVKEEKNEMIYLRKNEIGNKNEKCEERLKRG